MDQRLFVRKREAYLFEKNSVVEKPKTCEGQTFRNGHSGFMCFFGSSSLCEFRRMIPAVGYGWYG
jgi:hypothetical protein